MTEQSRRFQAIEILLLRSTSLGIKLLLTIYIARVIGLEALGFYGLVSSLMLAAPVFLGLGVMQTVGRNAVLDSPSELVGPISYYLLFTLSIYLLIVFFSWYWLTSLIALALAAIVFEHLNFEGYQFLINRSLVMRANVTHFVRSAFWVVIYFGMAYWFPGLRTLEALFSFWIAGSIMALVMTIIPFRDWPWTDVETRISVAFNWARNEARQARALYLGAVTNTLSTQGDRFLVTASLGLELAGVYVFFRQAISALTNLFTSALVQPARPRLINSLSIEMSEFRAQFKRLTVRSIQGATLTSIIAIVAVFYVLPFMNQSLLIDYFSLFPILIVFFIVNILAEGQQLVLFSQREDQAILMVSIATMIVGIGLNLLLLPTLSIWGAGLAIAAASLARFSVTLYIIHNKSLLRINRRHMSKK